MRTRVFAAVCASFGSVLIVADAGHAASRDSCEARLTKTTNPPELGVVQWRRGYEAAVAEARRSNKPLLVLFNEVPGCSTVNAFGKDVLSDVVVADAIEEFFVPVFVSNNEEGADRVVLKHFGEPTWNNPVIRIIDADENAIVPRHEGADAAVHLLSRIVAALEQQKTAVPLWLRAAADDAAPAGGSALYAMHCFWEGEVALGDVAGVTSTQPGFADGKEVVKVMWAKGANRGLIDSVAKANGFAIVEAADFRLSSKDDKHALSSSLQQLSLSKAQRTRINSAVGRGEDPRPWLSPRQRAQLACLP